jgi:hypothetical protein
MKPICKDCPEYRPGGLPCECPVMDIEEREPDLEYADFLAAWLKDEGEPF